MDAKDIVKKAREAIDRKDFESALILSKDLLEEDPRHYVALVYAGLACVELHQYWVGESFYQRATACQPRTPLAWQGLSSLYEKFLEMKPSESKTIKSLIEVFRKLLIIDSNNPKVLRFLDKIEKLQPSQNDPIITDIVQFLSDFLKANDVHKGNEEIVQKTKSLILKYLSENGKIALSHVSLFNDCYTSINSELKFDHHYTYFKLLHKTENLSKLLQPRLLNALRTNYKGLNLICEVCIEFHITQPNSAEFMELCIYLEELEELLIALDKEPRLAKSILALTKSKDYLSTKDSLEKLTREHPTYLQAYILLANVYHTLEFHEEAIIASKTVKRLLKSSPNAQFKKIVARLLCLIQLSSNDVEELNKAIGEAENIDDPSDEIITSLIYALIHLEKFDEAALCLEKLKENTQKCNLIKAAILKKQNLAEEALILLLQPESVQNNYEYWLILGDLYWGIGEQPNDSSNCLTSYLKATKANPVSFICYGRLGRFYKAHKDLDKARRCYEKSVTIKGTQSAYSELSRIYRKLHKFEENRNLLITLTSGNITLANCWAFLQLGIHYYEQEEFLPALSTLQYVLRIEPNNRCCWETLGDCYFSSGSYISALKCYTQAKALEPDEAVYSMLQVANIKKLVGEYADARDELEIVLKIDSKYVPALNYIAETYFLMGKQFSSQQLYGLARDNLQLAIEYVAKALEINPGLSCCWKIAADCCYVASLLPFKFSFLVVALPGLASDETDFFGEELVKIAIDIHCKALACQENKIAVYYDIACCYVHYARLSLEGNTKEERLNKAMAIIKLCIDSNANVAKYWNLFGIICFQLDKSKYSLAQHAFIKAIALDRNSVVSWTNLGALYLHLNELKLANEVFSQAQKSSPNYVQSWIGQALIAEASDMAESMHLFRHTMELSYHPESAIGYANWVCKTLRSKNPNEVIYSIDNMHAIPVACDGLRCFVANNPYDPCAWNMLGLLSERLGLNSDALDAYKKAWKYSNNIQVIPNLGRVFTTLQMYEEAIACFTSISKRPRNASIAYALVLFKAEDYQTAYEVYESALEQDVDGHNSIQSDLLVALASMLYMFQGPENAKKLLFQSTQLKARSPWSLYAVLSLGLLEDDFNLSNLVLHEIEKTSLDEEHLYHFSKLLVYTCLLQGEYKKGVSKLSRLIHENPSSSALWLHLSTLLYYTREAQLVPNNVIAKCAQASLILKGNDTSNLSMVLPIVCATSILSNDLRNALKYAARLVHFYPENKCANATLQYAKRLSHSTTHLITSKNLVFRVIHLQIMLRLIVYASAFFGFCAIVAFGQICQYSGHFCADDHDCCGGCCLHNICTDATRHCYDYEHLCLFHPCLGEQECKVYQAWDGSEPQVYCE